VARRSRARKSAAASPAAAATAAPPGARRFTITLGITFGLAVVAALLVPTTGATLLWLVVVFAATLGGARAGRTLGLPAGVAAAPAAGVAFALILAGGATRGAGPPPGLAVPALVVTALHALLVVDVVAATPRRSAPGGDRLAAALQRGPALRVVATVALGGLAARAFMVACGTEHDTAAAIALLALLAAYRLWRAPAPAGTLLAALLFGLVPGMLALGVGTDYGLWPPITAPLATALCGDPPGPLLGGVASLMAAALCWALTPPAAIPTRVPTA